MAGLLSLERREDVAVVTLQRPEKRNALSIDLRVELTEAFGALGDDPDVGAVVLTGAPPAFCSGHGHQPVRRRPRAQGAAGRDQHRLLPGRRRTAPGRWSPPSTAPPSPAASLWPCSATFGWRPSQRASASPSCRAASPRATRRHAPRCPRPLAAELTLTGRLLDAAGALGHGDRRRRPPGRRADGARGRAGRPDRRRRPARRPAQTKRRILLDRDRTIGHLFDEEERLLREALLGDEPDEAA